MYVLSEWQINLVSGAIRVYVTPEWKEDSAKVTGLMFGIVGVSFGILVAAGSAVFEIPLILGILGYAAGYAFSNLTYSSLENYTWYDSIEL